MGLHPPPPSPTEEETSNQRDGDILSAGKRVQEIQIPCIICGDFNNVAWSKSSRLFRKISGTLDPRVGNGFYSTFHSKYWFLRFPIDLLYHSPFIAIEKLKTIRYKGSDHLALSCTFSVSSKNFRKNEEVDTATYEDEIEAAEMISKGVEEDSDRKAIATEY